MWIVATTLAGIVTSSENWPGAGRSQAIGIRPRWVTATPDMRIGVTAGVGHVDPGRAGRGDRHAEQVLLHEREHVGAERVRLAVAGLAGVPALPACRSRPRCRMCA